MMKQIINYNNNKKFYKFWDIESVTVLLCVPAIVLTRVDDSLDERQAEINSLMGRLAQLEKFKIELIKIPIRPASSMIKSEAEQEKRYGHTTH